MKTTFKILCAALLLGSASLVSAEIVLNKSTLVAVGKQLGAPMTGNFKKFSANISFDPAKPTDAKVTLEIVMNSYDLGDDLYNKEVAGKNFFDAGKYPTATFVSTGVKSTGAGKYEFAGNLTMKGKTRPVAAVVTYKPEGPNAVFDGELIIKRTAFGVGEGEWGDVSLVADEVQVKFHIVNAPSTPSAAAAPPTSAVPAKIAPTAPAKATPVPAKGTGTNGTNSINNAKGK